ncbi:MAG: hypothetical protein CM1200mP41_34840 [Gammaproteobacteria bacterium]|nr:MAG: hypothetical protein CM1200mP41_34840 [Gammaproteobacteria bacterium]
MLPLIHGHTHRPGNLCCYIEESDSVAIVLGDWSAGPSYVSAASQRIDLHFKEQVLSLSQSEEDPTLHCITRVETEPDSWSKSFQKRKPPLLNQGYLMRLPV